MKPILREHSVTFAMLACAACTIAAVTVETGHLHNNAFRLRKNEFANSSQDRPKLPRVFLWAWERPEDLRFLNPTEIGIAFLAETVEIRPQPSEKGKLGIVLRPRRQPLRVGSATPLMAVVRIETSNDAWNGRAKHGAEAPAAPAIPLYDPAQREAVVDMIVAAAKLPRVQALQIDFDASKSEQSFYAALLADVREGLPREMPLSITALASWCIGDAWLNKLPLGTIDEAVPMLFRMGPDAGNVATYIESGNEFKPTVCRSSLGLSTDEKFSQLLLKGALRPRLAHVTLKRIYIFSGTSWTDDEFRSVTKEVER